MVSRHTENRKRIGCGGRVPAAPQIPTLKGGKNKNAFQGESRSAERGLLARG